MTEILRFNDFDFWKDFLLLRNSAGLLAVTASIEFISQILLNKFSVVNGIIEYKLTFLADSIFQSSQFNQQRFSMLKIRQNLNRKQHQLLNHVEKPYTGKSRLVLEAVTVIYYKKSWPISFCKDRLVLKLIKCILHFCKLTLCKIQRKSVKVPRKTVDTD